MAFCICLVYRRWSALFGDAIELIVTERVANQIRSKVHDQDFTRGSGLIEWLRMFYHRSQYM
jgi:hypothetical protein